MNSKEKKRKLNFRKSFVYCPECNRRVIERLPNGIWRFIFGSKRTSEGELLKDPPVYIEIHGSLRMKCINRNCDNILVLNYFPNKSLSLQSEDPLKEKSDNG